MGAGFLLPWPQLYAGAFSVLDIYLGICAQYAKIKPQNQMETKLACCAPHNLPRIGLDDLFLKQGNAMDPDPWLRPQRRSRIFLSPFTPFFDTGLPQWARAALSGP